ncbi:hypothetical protein QF025_002691 [Paraburkholderia graminis]|uniref:Uncharacterized protein n=1 Tax=Paraburkholderia graminis TaxID=60548 RepID=A0ABD5CGF6_9BURK|nr:hypothetical protein [Paraburkholderia graminis]
MQTPHNLRLRIIPAQTHATQRVFGQGVADLGAALFAIQHEGIPLVERVTDRFGVDRINSVTVATINMSISGRAARHRLRKALPHTESMERNKNCQLQAQM